MTEKRWVTIHLSGGALLRAEQLERFQGLVAKASDQVLVTSDRTRVVVETDDPGRLLAELVRDETLDVASVDLLMPPVEDLLLPPDQLRWLRLLGHTEQLDEIDQNMWQGASHEAHRYVYGPIMYVVDGGVVHATMVDESGEPHSWRTPGKMWGREL